MTREEALAILDAGDFALFVGVQESLEVEFKGAPYQLDNDGQKFELAKDVSALANAAGGVIVIGARTTRDDEAAVDAVDEIRAFERALVNEQQYEGTITDRVYPRLRELQVRFFPSQADDERGLIAIDVPPQQEIDRYFLVQSPMVEGGDRTPGWLVGIAVRGVGRVDPRRIGEIHTLINRGLNVGAQLADVAEGVAELRELSAGGGIAPPDSPADRLAARLDERVAEIDN